MKTLIFLLVASIGDLWGEPLGLRPEFKSTTEPEAIFKACQWILDNKDKQ